MSKVLIWAEQFWPAIGGIEVLLSDLILDLAQDGIEFEVICNRFYQDSPSQDQFHGIPVHRFSFHKALQERNIVEICRISSEISKIKQRFNPDIIHFHSTGPSLFYDERTYSSDDAARLFTVHGYWEDDKYQDLKTGAQSLLYRSLDRAALITTVSKEVMLRTIEFAPNLSERIELIYNGRKAPKNQIEPISCSPPRILGVGRLIEDKGFDLLVRAMPQILAKFPDAQLVLAGDGSARLMLETLAAEVGIQDSVSFLGWIEPKDVFEVISSCSMLAVPSRWREAFGLVALEAAFQKRPIVATDIGGLSEIINDGISGFLFECENVDELAKAICKLIADPALAKRFAEVSYKQANEKFSWSKCIVSYQQAYQRLFGLGAGDKRTVNTA